MKGSQVNSYGLARRIVLSLIWTILATICLPAVHASIGSAPDAVTTSIDPTTPPSPATNLQTNLSDLAETTSQLRRALSDVLHEMQRHQTVIVSDPYFDDPFLYNFNSGWNLSYPIPDDAIYSYNAGALLPPRQKWLDHFMSQVVSLVRLLQTDVSSINLSNVQDPASGSQLAVLQDTTRTIQQQSQELQILTQAKDCDKAGLAKKAQEMRDNVAGVDNIQKQLVAELTKEAKDTDS